MKRFKFMFDAGFGYPTYLAHLTIGIGRHTLWFSITTMNWNKIELRQTKNPWLPRGACFSVFTVAYTSK